MLQVQEGRIEFTILRTKLSARRAVFLRSYSTNAELHRRYELLLLPLRLKDLRECDLLDLCIRCVLNRGKLAIYSCPG